MDIFPAVYSELQAKIKHLSGQYAKYEPAFNAMDEERISGIITSGGQFWFEYGRFTDVSDKEFDLLTEYIIKHKGLKQSQLSKDIGR